MGKPAMKWFGYEHLRPELQQVSQPVAELARRMDEALPESEEKAAGLRKLLEAKDCFVRAALEGEDNGITAAAKRNAQTLGARLANGLANAKLTRNLIAISKRARNRVKGKR